MKFFYRKYNFYYYLNSYNRVMQQCANSFWHKYKYLHD